MTVADWNVVGIADGAVDVFVVVEEDGPLPSRTGGREGTVSVSVIAERMNAFVQ